MSTSSFFLGCLIAAAIGGYQAADENGWFPHKRIVSVSMSRNWISGEFKQCQLSGDFLVCDPNADQHQMEVEFRGPSKDAFTICPAFVEEFKLPR